MGIKGARTAGGARAPSSPGPILADELAWVTSHIFRKTTATILDDAGHSARQVADQLGHSRTSTTSDDYIGRKIRNPAAAEALDKALRPLHDYGQQEPEGPGH
jgi:integrase